MTRVERAGAENGKATHCFIHDLLPKGVRKGIVERTVSLPPNRLVEDQHLLAGQNLR